MSCESDQESECFEIKDEISVSPKPQPVSVRLQIPGGKDMYTCYIFVDISLLSPTRKCMRIQEEEGSQEPLG